MSAPAALAVVDGDGAPVRPGPAAPIAWWSPTKTAIAALALRLADDGRIDLDAPEPGAPYTLRQLLRHTSGLPDYGALPGYKQDVAAGRPPWSDDELFAQVAADRLLFPPGEGWRYSNVGYAVARRRLEDRAGLPLGETLLRFVLRPLGLRATRLAETAGDMAGLLLPPPHPYHPGWVFHGTLIGPIGEAALFLHRLLRPGFLSAAGRAALTASHPVPADAAGPPWRAPRYGTGMMLGDWEAGSGRHVAVVGHGAGGPGSQGATFRVTSGARSVTVSAYVADGGPAPDALVRQAAGPFL